MCRYLARSEVFDLARVFALLHTLFCVQRSLQFNLPLSPYPCFISLLYLDLYVLGDDALIS